MVPHRRGPVSRALVIAFAVAAAVAGLMLAGGLPSSGLPDPVARAEAPVGPSPRREAVQMAARPAHRADRGPLAQISGGSPLEGFDPLAHHLVRGKLVSDLPGGRRAELSLDPDLQSRLEAELERYQVPFGAVVAMEPSTGRIRAYVSHSSINPSAGDLCRDPTPPTASVFKVVTGSALVDHGVTPDTRVCYGGGLEGIMPADLVDNPKRDTRCETLATAMGYSINAIFAKLASRDLTPSILRRYASAFGFGQRLPFDAPTHASPMDVPTGRLEFARTAAGFWHMHMSPLHAALIASTIADGGRMPRAFMVERVVDARGKIIYRATPSIFRNVIPRYTARTVAGMMTRTVSEGTAHHYFFDSEGHPFLPGIRVAGKTGTLMGTDPYRAYTWFIGFAPVDHPKLAVAALVVNSPRWRIKGAYLGREALRTYLVAH